MIFKNNLAYMVRNETRNKTNTKKYDLLNKDFIYEATFTPGKHNDNQYESCVFGRTGYCMGIFTHYNTVKWVWFRIDENDNVVYDSIIFNSSEESKHHFDKWWNEWIKENAPVELDEQLKNCLFRRWAWLDNSAPYVLNWKWPNDEITDSWEIEHIQNIKLKNWIIKMNDFKDATSSLITPVVKVKVVKKGNSFSMYINDIHFMTKKVGKLYDYSDQTIFVGVGNPYNYGSDPLYFNGEINDVKLYHNSSESDKSLYLWFDFKRNAEFKTFDKSGNGNHGQKYETDEAKMKINDEFNQYARPAKIV